MYPTLPLRSFSVFAGRREPGLRRRWKRYRSAISTPDGNGYFVTVEVDVMGFYVGCFWSRSSS